MQIDQSFLKSYDPFDFSEVGPTPAHIAEAIRKKSDSPIDADLKTEVDQGVMHVKYAGGEQYEVVGWRDGGRVAKQLKTVRNEDHQHDSVKESAAQLSALIEQHPYLANALKENWAKICVQDDGMLGLEFKQGHSVNLGAFDESTSVSKAGALGKAKIAHQEIENALVEYRESRGEIFVLRDGAPMSECVGF